MNLLKLMIKDKRQNDRRDSSTWWRL